MVSYRRYRRFRRRARRYGRRYYRRSYARRYVNGSSRSGLRMKCNQTVTVTAAAGHGDDATDAAITVINPYAAGTKGVVNNSLYRAYADLYEETKMIGMKIVLSVTSQVGGIDTPSLQIYTAFDRRHGNSEAIPTVAQIKAAASSTVATALNNNVAKISRSIYASDLIEKAQWHDSSITAGAGDAAWIASGANPNFFCPSCFIFFNSPSLAATHNITFSLSITYYVAFRNPKYGGSSSSKELASKQVTFPDEPGDADEMGDGEYVILDEDTMIGDDGRQVSSAPTEAHSAASLSREPREGSLRKALRSSRPGPVQKNV